MLSLPRGRQIRINPRFPKLERLLIEGAEAALKYAEDTALLRSWHPTTPIERLRSEIPNLSADAELEQVLQRITEFHNVDRTVTLPDGVKAVSRTELEAVCFHGETKVIVENGEIEDIQYVYPGLLVLSRCEKTGEIAYRKVLRHSCREWVPMYRLWMHGYDDAGRSRSFGSLNVTVEHPFWVREKGWVPVCELQLGDPLLSSEHPTWDVRVKKVESFGKSEVHNLEVEDFNTFFVGEYGIWVHNCNRDGLKVWELLPREESPARVLDNVFNGKNLTPDRVALLDELATLDTTAAG